MDRYACIHGHFYQPPRENAWLEEIELQDSAYPYHDWNEKICAQCYAPNARSRILDGEEKIIDIVNNYSLVSFDFGPALLAWLERHKPAVYQDILEADRLSRKRFSGHGSAIAQAYNHMIMPLACTRDKQTQVIWGVADFERRFGRLPEGMWLPETAVDIETLEVLAEKGILYTILSPRQACRVRKMDRDSRWEDVTGSTIDPSMAYLCSLPSGRTLNIFFYDGPISHDISFGRLLESGETFAQRLASGFDDLRGWSQLVHVATDGETFGHHHHHGDRALAYCLHFIETQGIARLTNYGEYLEKHPPTHRVEILANSSWSCIHGVERWRDDCGCNSGMHPGWTQGWRRPLREAMDWLRERVAAVFEEHGSGYLRSPWMARNDYIGVILDRSTENLDAFLGRHAVRELTRPEKITVLSLLEMQRNAMLMYTSCGWFFDEVSGIESVQIMHYAARVIQFAERILGESIEPEFMRRLESAPSNVCGNAAKAYETYVKPAQLDLMRVGVHYAISSLFQNYADEAAIYCYQVKREAYEVAEAGKLRLSTGRVRVSSDITLDEQTCAFAVLHLGDHNINSGMREFQGEKQFNLMTTEMKEAFDRGDVPETIRLMDKHFGTNNFSIWHLFRDEQRKVIDQILEITYRNIESSYRQVYENSYPIMIFLQSLNIPLPKAIAMATEHTINVDLKRLFEEDRLDLTRLESLASSATRWNLRLDNELLWYTISSWVTRQMAALYENPEDLSLLKDIENALAVISTLPVHLELWEAQNNFFYTGKKILTRMSARAKRADPEAKEWLLAFERLGMRLHVR